VYAWGYNGYGQLGTNGIGSSSTPIVVAGISNAVLVGANPSGSHSLAVTVDQGTNRYWAWGFNVDGQVGNGTNANNAGGDPNQYTPAQIQFCTRCQRCVQLATSGILTAQCNGTLFLYLNNEIGRFDDNSGSFTVTVDSFGQTNVPANAESGVAVGAVTNGGVYTYSASGFCQYDSQGDVADPNGNDPNGHYIGCSSINVTNTICPARRCFSLVGKIQ